MSINIYPDEIHEAQLGDPEYYPAIDDYCEAIREATKGFGTDERAIIDTLGKRNMIERSLIAYRYKQKYGGQELKELMKKENMGNFGFLTQLLSLPAPEAEAKIIRKATKGLGTNEKLLWSVICGRSNAEIQILKTTYFRRYNRDLVSLVSSELSGDLKKLHMACLQGMEEEFDPGYHNASKAEDDAKRFYKKGQGRWGTDEAALFEIICKAPPRYLEMVDDAYVAAYNVNLERALEKELSGKARQAAVFTLGMKLKPYETLARHIKSTCAGMGTDNLGLSCAILRYQHILPQIQMEHTNLFCKTIGDRVVDETNGDYKRLLLEMVRVAWPGDGSSSEPNDSSSSERSDSSSVDGSVDWDAIPDLSNPYARDRLIESIRNSSGDGLFHRAAQLGNLAMIRWAVEAGHSDLLHVMDSNGWNPLHEAARAGHPDIVEYLLREARLDPNAKTNNGEGQTAFELALEYHRTDHALIYDVDWTPRPMPWRNPQLSNHGRPGLGIYVPSVY